MKSSYDLNAIILITVWSLILFNLGPDLSDLVKHDKHKNVDRLKYFCLDLTKLDGLTFLNISYIEQTECWSVRTAGTISF